MSTRVIHLVDDDPAVRGMLARLLVSGGYQVRQYASGSELLKAAGALAEDGMVLLDVDMPEPDGLAVQRALIERDIRIPVVMMTGSGDLTVLAFKAGATDFVQKPFGRSELLAIVGDIFEQADA